MHTGKFAARRKIRFLGGWYQTVLTLSLSRWTFHLFSSAAQVLTGQSDRQDDHWSVGLKYYNNLKRKYSLSLSILNLGLNCSQSRRTFALPVFYLPWFPDRIIRFILPLLVIHLVSHWERITPKKSSIISPLGPNWKELFFALFFGSLSLSLPLTWDCFCCCFLWTVNTGVCHLKVSNDFLSIKKKTVFSVVVLSSVLYKWENDHTDRVLEYLSAFRCPNPNWWSRIHRGREPKKLLWLMVNSLERAFKYSKKNIITLFVNGPKFSFKSREFFFSEKSFFFIFLWNDNNLIKIIIQWTFKNCQRMPLSQIWIQHFLGPLWSTLSPICW